MYCTLMSQSHVKTSLAVSYLVLLAEAEKKGNLCA